MILRKKRTSKELSIDASDNDCGSDDRWEMRDLREDPECLYARHERSELLGEAIRQLRPRLRTAVEVQQANEYSIQELADSLGISLASVKSRLLRARLSLRTLSLDNNLMSYHREATRSPVERIEFDYPEARRRITKNPVISALRATGDN
jgi:RNA polymerase sigma-70 factor (ECF subfamily)